MNKFDNMPRLDHNVSIYVPSTMNGNEPIDNTEFVMECRRELSELFGGCTVFPASGSYIMPDGTLVNEDISIVSANTDDLTDFALNKLHAIAERIRERMNQFAVTVTIDDALYFVEQE